MGAMSTTTLPEVDTRPETTDKTGDDRPDMFHYVKKDRIAESAVLGNMVVALCGETFPVTKSPAGSPVCPQCKEIFDGLPRRRRRRVRPGRGGAERAPRLR